MARRLGITLVAVVAFLLRASAKPALDPNQPIQNYLRQSWQTAQGLPQNSVFSLAQTPDGYIWLGTEEGLARFDGLRFTLFNKNNSGLAGNMVLALLVDHTGALWAGTYGGGVTRVQNGEFRSYTTHDGLPSNQ